MQDLLHYFFGVVCGQNPDHCWCPGGLMLPFCQRCTGLYIGACVAAMLHWRIRPAASDRWLWMNGGFLLFMIPFGFHWLPQGPGLRTATGVLFGFGLVAFLWLMPGRAAKPGGAASGPARGCSLYAAGAAATLALILWLAQSGGALAAGGLILTAALGALALSGLVLANAVPAFGWLIRRIVNRGSRAPA